MAKKKKVTKVKPKNDRAFSPLDFLEDECIGIMSGSEENSREPMILPEFIKKETMQIAVNIQNEPLEPLHNLKKYLKNLRDAADVIIKLEDEDDIKETGLGLDAGIEIKQEILSDDELSQANEGEKMVNSLSSIYSKESFDKMISTNLKRFHIKDSFVMIPRDIPTEPSIDTDTYFVMIPREKLMEPSIETDTYLETETGLESDNEVEDEISKASFKSFIEGIEDSPITNINGESEKVNHCDTEKHSKVEETNKGNEEQSKCQDTSFSDKAASQISRKTNSEKKKKKRRKEMFVFTNVKTTKSKPLNTERLPDCGSNPEESSKNKNYEGDALEHGEEHKFLEVSRSVEFTRDSKHTNNMIEPEIVGQCVDEIDFSSLVEDVQEVIRHLEETELKRNEKSDIELTEIKEKVSVAQSKNIESIKSNESFLKILETQHSMSKNIQTAECPITEDETEKVHPSFQNKVITTEIEDHTPGQEIDSEVTDEISHHAQEMLNTKSENKNSMEKSSTFQNDENIEGDEIENISENNFGQDDNSQEYGQISHHDQEMQNTKAKNKHRIEHSSFMHDKTIETEGNKNFSAKNYEEGIKDLRQSDQETKNKHRLGKSTFHPDETIEMEETQSVEHEVIDNLKENPFNDEEGVSENSGLWGIKENVRGIDTENPIIKLTIVREKETEEETTTEKHTESNESQTRENEDTKKSQCSTEKCINKENEKVVIKLEQEVTHQDKIDDDHYSDIDVLLLSESEDESTENDYLLKSSSHVPIPIKIEPSSEITKTKIAVIPVYENISDSECEDIPTLESRSQNEIKRQPMKDKEARNDSPTDETHILKEIFDDEKNSENPHNRSFDEFDEIVNFTQGPGVPDANVDNGASVNKQSPSSLPSTSIMEEIQVENVISKAKSPYENRLRINESIFNSEYAVPSTSKTPVTSNKSDLVKVSGFHVPDRGKSSSPSAGKSSENLEMLKKKKDDKESRGRPKSRISNVNKANFLEDTPLSTSTESSRAPTPIPSLNKKETKREKRDYEKDYRKQKDKVKEQEKVLTTRQMKITTLKKSNAKLEKKVAERKIETVKMEAEVREFKKEIEKITKKCNELVGKKEEKEKTMDTIQNDLAIKQQRIVKLEHMLKKKTVPPPKADGEAIKKLQSESLEKQRQIDEMEAFLQGKDASVKAKTDKINLLETENSEKDRKIFTLECLFKEKDKSFLLEKSQNDDLCRKNDQLEKYVLQKTHIRPAKPSSDLELQVKTLETQVKDLQNEKISWIKQNTKLSEFEMLCKALQTKNKELQTSLNERDKKPSKSQQQSADDQRIANLELQNSDLMSQVQHVSILQRRIRDLEDKLKIEFSNPEGEEATDAEKLAALPHPPRNLPLNFLTRETPLFDAYSRTPYNRTAQTPRLVSGQKSATETIAGQASGSFATSDLITKLMKMRPVIPPPPINIDITKPPPPINIDLVRPDSGDDASQISLPTSSLISNPPLSTESAHSETIEGNSTLAASTNPLGLQKFSALCSGSFNVSQTHWSDDSNDEDDHDNDITDGLLNIGGQRSSGTQEESESTTPRPEDQKIMSPPIDEKNVIDSTVPNPLYNPFDQRDDDIRPEVDESMCINQPGVEYHESHNSSDDKNNLSLSSENDKKAILTNAQIGDNETEPVPTEEDEEVKREIIAEILDIQIKRKELREKLNTSIDSIPDVPETIVNENDGGEPSKKDKSKKKKKHGHDKKRKHKKHKKEGKHKKKKKEKVGDEESLEKVKSTLLKDSFDFDDDFLQLEPDISDLLDLALSDDELPPRKSRKERFSSSSDGEISSSPSPLRETLKSPTPNLDDLAELEERLKSLNSEANKTLNSEEANYTLNQEETRVVKKLSVDEVFNVLSDISENEMESPEKQKTSSPEKNISSPENKKLKISVLATKRRITIKLDKNKEQEKSPSAQSSKSQVEESVDTRSLIEKAKDIHIECKNDQAASQQQEKPKFDDRETEQMLKDLHSCLPKKKDFKLSSIKVRRKRSPSPESTVDETFSRSVKRVKSLRKRSKSKEDLLDESSHKDDDRNSREKDKRRSKEKRKDGDRSISKDKDHSQEHHRQDISPRNDGSLARKLYDRIHRRSDSQIELSQMEPPPPLKENRDRSKSQSQDSKSTSVKRGSLERHSKGSSDKRPSKQSGPRERKNGKSRSNERKPNHIKKEKHDSRSESKEKRHSRSKSKDRRHSRSRSRDRKHSRSISHERKKRRPRRSPSRFTRIKRSRSRSKDRNRQQAQRIKNKYINEKIRNQRRNHENNMDTEENCKKRGVQLYWDYETQQNRVRLDGYGANGPAEILVNMMAVDKTIKVHFRTKCMTCGKDILGANKFKHFENGVCKKKSTILQAGGVVFCSYCEITGAHWVEACPLLVSFCFSCWVWGHNYLHHHVADKGYLERLMRKFNEMRNWHHVNSEKTRDSRIIPMNELIPLNQDDVAIRYEGKQEDIDDIARGIPCSTSRPACWLVKENWTNIYKILEKPGFEWVTNADGFCLKKLPDNTEQFLSKFHNLLPGNHMKEEQLDYEYDDSQGQEEEEVEGDEEGYSEEDDITDWLDY